MSTRWIAVQYVGDTLRLPIVDEFSMDKPFGSSELEREVRRIVVNPFSDSPQTFVPESDNAKLRELCKDIRICARDNQCSLCYIASGKCDFSDRMRELGVEVDNG